MKKKIILIALIGSILSVIIYFFTKTDEKTIMALGDGLAQGMTAYDIEGKSYNDYLKEDYENNHKLKRYYEYAKSNITVKELINDIKNNKIILYKESDIEIQHAINEADILTITIGIDELENKKITSEVRREFKNDIEELFSMIHLLNQNKVIVLGLYKTKSIDYLTLEKINAIIRDIALSNNFTYIDINPLLDKEEFYLVKSNYYINYLGHKEIYKAIKKSI